MGKEYLSILFFKHICLHRLYRNGITGTYVSPHFYECAICGVHILCFEITIGSNRKDPHILMIRKTDKHSISGICV